MKETYPLRWPEGWPRTLLNDREKRTAWKKTERQSIESLEDELRRFGALEGATITRKDPSDIRTAPDPSIAIWFSRKRDDDFSWQGALGISNPAPTTDEIDSAFRKLASKHHPDSIARGSGGDLETFHALSQHKGRAMDYVNRRSGSAFDYSIACDTFKEARWNITAICNTIKSLRQMERDGTSKLLERTMQAFAALPQEASNVHAATAR